MECCSNFKEDPFVCDDVGEPKGQCLHCGYYEHEHGAGVARHYERPAPEFVTLALRELPDGCVTIDSAPVLAAALPLVGTPAQREGFPRFTLSVDGQTQHTDRKDVFRRWIESIQHGSKARVFRNLGQGVTLDFDYDLR